MASPSRFLADWALEIRAGFTPTTELDVLARLPPACAPQVAAALELASTALIARERALEAAWIGATPNDRLTAAFATLEVMGYFAREHCGASLHDGWARVGIDAVPSHRGAVFYTHEDVHDALEGESLLVAFGASGRAAGRPHDDAAVATAALDVLARYGIAAAWTGRVEDRIEIAPFAWQRRRWTARPPNEAEPLPSPVAWTRVDRAAPPAAGSPDDDARRRFDERVVVDHHRTPRAFDGWLATRMRHAWWTLGGERGQVGHVEDPPALAVTGETTVVAPVDALANLHPDEAAHLRRRGIARRPRHRRWWSEWAAGF